MGRCSNSPYRQPSADLNLSIINLFTAGEKFPQIYNSRSLYLLDKALTRPILRNFDSFFVMHSRKGEKVTTLDVHILKWLSEQGVENVPLQTPQNEVTYKRLETEFLERAKKMGKSPAELDLEIWKKKAKKGLTSSRV